MILITRPPGRGNWEPVVVTIQGPRNAPLPLELVGAKIVVGEREYRIVTVLEDQEGKPTWT